jgi:hypothetical protein
LNCVVGVSFCTYYLWLIGTDLASG